MARDGRIDEKIAQAAPFARPILEHLRALVHETLPGVEETIKWGMPHFIWKGKNLAGMAAFKAHCGFVIHGDGRQGPAGDRALGQYGKLTSLADLPAEELKTKLLAARDRIETAGRATFVRTPKPKPDKEVAPPQDFAAALDAVPAARAVFDAFPPSQKREYVEWIAGAKQDATRERRLTQAIEWIAEGKRRNWKYETR
jgi:uncharacterized protein YdeI (YjbR/CyaY-like superfamily)